MIYWLLGASWLLLILVIVLQVLGTRRRRAAAARIAELEKALSDEREREYDRRMAAVIGRRGKSDAVRDVVLNVNIPVSKRDIMEMLPDVSESTVASELKRMLDAGEIVKRGSTRAARYIPMNRG